jgi:hypothetical protein
VAGDGVLRPRDQCWNALGSVLFAAAARLGNLLTGPST